MGPRLTRGPARAGLARGVPLEAGAVGARGAARGGGKGEAPRRDSSLSLQSSEEAGVAGAKWAKGREGDMRPGG